MNQFLDKNGRQFTAGCTFIKEVRGATRTYFVHKLVATQVQYGPVVRAVHCQEVTPDTGYHTRTRVTDLLNTIIVDTP